MSTKRVIVLATYADAEAGRQAFRDIRQNGFHRTAAIRRVDGGQAVVDDGGLSRRGAIAGALLAATLVAGLSVVGFWPAGQPDVVQRLAAGLLLALGAAVGWLIARQLFGVSPSFLRRCGRWIASGETFVVIETPLGNARAALARLRGEEGTRATTFVIRPRARHDRQPTEARQRERFSLERLKRHASTLASRQAVLPRPGRARALWARLNSCERTISAIADELVRVAELEQSISLSAEWLLDNVYVVQRHVADLRRNLSPELYRALPTLAAGPHQGEPRVYELALELVAHTDADLHEPELVEFLLAYQTVSPLTIGELWAAPLMLRLALIEHLSDLALRISRRQRDFEAADFWAGRLLTLARHDPNYLLFVLAELAQAHPDPSPVLADRLLSQLQGESLALDPVRSWLERKWGAPVAEVLREEQRAHAADQVAIADAIGSLRWLAGQDWRNLFERVSPVDRILATDPAGVYPHMDFGTRDRYRHAIEELARRSGASEPEVARAVVAAARGAADLDSQSEVNCHVGYYLIDRGREELEARISYRPSLGQWLWRRVVRYPAATYLTAIGASTGLTLGAALSLAGLAGAHPALVAALAGLALVPASEVAVQLVNFAVTRLIRPRALPKLDFDDGIPDEWRTLVVVPTLFSSREAIQEDLEHLETCYLANPDANLHYALLADFVDAPRREMPEDSGLLKAAIDGVEALNRRHGNRFLLFIRDRQWSESEQVWMGWERKRGKLEELNRWLTAETAGDGPVGRTATGHADTLRPVAGCAGSLRGVRCVITLDSDTQLPHGAARRLVGTLAHPLNRPRLSPDGRAVVGGYTIIQPRVSPTLPSAAATRFSRFFSDPVGVDPYTQVVSDLYQDLTGEGSYYGKGIYDVATFNRVLGGRFPEATLLSHDLLEGAHVRVGLATDIEVFDVFPSSYLAHVKRQHRWIRGDWQIAEWCAPRVSNQAGVEARPLSAINRWKILDNLRRSLVPPVSVAVLLGGWLLTPSSALAWSLLVALALFLPALLQTASQLVSQPLSALASWQTWRELGTPWVRAVVTIALLPHQAAVALDAIGRVWYRRTISHRHLLEWQTFRESNSNHRQHDRQLLRQTALVSLFAGVTTATLARLAPGAIVAALPFLALWLVSPAVAVWLGVERRRRAAYPLSPADRSMLRRLARETWRYFDDLVGPQTNWLPPDNFQEALRVEVAERTSPTNVGLWLLATLAAHDSGYLTVEQVVERGKATLDTLDRLERFAGHFLNWYDTRTLEPLRPRYVSTVDSGNLLASLWALAAGYRELLSRPLVGPEALRGLADTLALALVHDWPATAAQPEVDPRRVDRLISALTALFDNPPADPSRIVQRLRAAAAPARELADLLRPAAVSTAPLPDAPATRQSGYWIGRLAREVETWNDLVDRYLPRVDERREGSAAGQAPLTSLTLSELAFGPADALSVSPDPPAGGLASAGEALDAAGGVPSQPARDLVERIEQLVARVERLADEMNMRFLYDASRRLFTVGYNVDEQRSDSSYYDLLASEARLASFVAIARGDVPAEHWFALGRPFGRADGGRVLFSWSGTMFEYLMPLLMMPSYENTLLDEACRAAVALQIDYGARRGVPWGISEAAFSAVDRHHIYQYRAFGVPGLGLKRDLDEDLVVAPYATALALLVAPRAAVENLKRLTQAGLRGDYGYYDSIDYTPRRLPAGSAGVVVYTYMAHHQGMTLLALDNVLHDNATRRRFSADPRVRATEPLLFERIPVAPPLIEGSPRGEPPPRVSRAPLGDEGSHLNPHEAPAPVAYLLGNGTYTVFVTGSGGGGSRWRDVDISRWRADTTRDAWGAFFYVKDLESGAVWSTAYQPLCQAGSGYAARLLQGAVVFERRDEGIATTTEITVSPEDDAEVRRLTLVNHSNRRRVLELTSYVELAIAPHGADVAHPAFGKLFVETAAWPEQGTLLAGRRPRSPREPAVWAVHVVALPTSPEANVRTIAFETDRARFLGRGRGPEHPLALDGALSGSAGHVLDPIFSLRCRVTLAPGRRVQLAFITAAAETRARALALAERYRDLAVAHRAFDLARSHAQLLVRQLHATAADIHHYHELAGHLLYPQAQLRAAQETLRGSQLSQSRLWAYGISGDLPILLVTVGDRQDVELVREALTAHTYWRLLGLKADLVILNEEAGGYLQQLQEELRRLIQAHAQYTGVDEPGGVFLRSADQMPAEDVRLLHAVASAVLVASRGPLAQQLGIPAEPARLPAPLALGRRPREEPSAPLPFLELPYFNGLGGFTPDGKEYAIYLGPGTETPHPWVNVFANPSFGALVSESGPGFAWYGNSQANRLLPWSNDPVSDPAGDAIYIRDEDLGVFWSPTAAPIRENDAYRARHGQGYTLFEHNSHAIEQQLVTFVPVDEAGGAPVRVQRLRLRNSATRPRRLSVFFYAEWVLGPNREESQRHIVSSWDAESGALLARNSYHPDYGGRIAFASASPLPTSHTADRTEFLGRNGSLARPAALARQGLSGRTGAGLDPCAGLQVALDVEPGGEVEVTFVLGQAADGAEARRLVARFRDPERVEQALEETRAWWDRLLETVQVDTPELAVNFLLNRWLLYQTLSCRMWARSAFYQSGGAIGFRDQLQDCLALLYAAPHLTRQQILTAAARQFVEGDVQHWWHPQSGAGIRSRVSDDLLWLPYAVTQYVRVTGDWQVLDEVVPFLDGRALEEREPEAYFTPAVALETGSLLEHCRRAIARALALGPHGLPLIGTGDWNDGLNLVGPEGRGESVWLAWFLIEVLNGFAELLEGRGEPDAADEYRARARLLADAVEREAWDGEWYRRAYFDDGTPLGSGANDECRIDSLPQSWAAISGAGAPARVERALRAVEQHLVREKDRLILLFTPPFEGATPSPGYVAAYPPGVRENGGQYTHAAIWVALAFARLGDGDRAGALLRLLNPIERTRTPEEVERYRVEPYVVAADVYSLAGRVGQGGWTWYTGSSGWMYRVWLEELLGFHLRPGRLVLEPVIPSWWRGFRIRYRFGSAQYELEVQNPDRVSRGVAWVELDGNRLPDRNVPLRDDGATHRVVVRLGGQASRES